MNEKTVQSNFETLAQSNKDKLYFVHIPKCAGTSLKVILYKIFGKDRVLKVWNSKIGSDVSLEGFAELDLSKILTYPCIAGHLPYVEAEAKLGKNIERYFVCTLIRNPVDRALSLWNYVSTHPELPNHDLVSKMCFEEFVEKRVSNQQCRFICGRANANDALKTIHDEYDLVLPLEKYDDFISVISQKFNYEIEEYEIKNKSKKLLSREELSEDLISLIKKRSSEDMTLYEKVIQS